MGNGKESGISRREFARRAALVSAASAFGPASLLEGAPAPSLPLPETPGTPQAAASNLSTASQAEIESRVQAINSLYGFRLSAAQKDDIRRLATDAQSGLDRLRAYPAENGDGPALYLHPLNERPRKIAGISPKEPLPGTARKP
jgi:hypothetical protein